MNMEWIFDLFGMILYRYYTCGFVGCGWSFVCWVGLGWGCAVELSFVSFVSACSDRAVSNLNLIT